MPREFIFHIAIHNMFARKTACALLYFLPIILASWSFAQEERIPAAIRGIAPAATVRIETPGSPGSGVVIANAQDRCRLLAAYHVTEQLVGAEIGEIRFQNGATIQLDQSMISRIGLSDLSIIEANTACPGGRAAILGNSNDIMIGDLVYVSGYSANISPEVAVPSFRIGSGRILSINDQPDGYSLTYDATTTVGMSGGPLFSSKGLLIGVHGRGETLGLTGQKLAAMAMSVKLLQRVRGPHENGPDNWRSLPPIQVPRSPGKACPGVVC